MKIAAIYARVSSDQQKEEKTIASQTAALIEFARQENYQVPDEWVFEDEGYSGANLIRPGLERIRDLAAEGQIQSVLALSPDRLSRKYAYQVLLTEELARHGVEMVFIKAPHSGTPEDQLLIQFQGMIAEYERAQILERSRRGKRHRAKQGEVSVLSGAPYGYRYIRKTDESAAYYEIIESEADVVRKIFNLYTVEGLSIGAITRQLTELGVPTRKQKPRWERSVIWAILRNPAYQGRACFGKTAITARQRITRPLRLRGGISSRNSANHERPHSEWIEIPVPALVSEETFALSQEKLTYNKQHGPRRTIEPSILQGLVHCRQCSYALYRNSSRTSARKIYYYRCTGLRLAETLTAFLERLRSNADTLDIGQRQRIMRLLVKEVIVGKDLITIKHSIPGQAAPTGGNPPSSKTPAQHNTTQIDKSYPLCKGRDRATLRYPFMPTF